MLTAEDKDEIRRFIADVLHEDLRVHEVQSDARPIVEVTARAMEVFGTREKALRWLETPVPSLGDRTPLSLLNTPEGLTDVMDALGRIEHGVW